MFRFSREQSVVNLGGVRVGGQPGELPSALAGTIFYHGHGIVKDDRTGSFDEERAGDLLMRQAELSDETGCPALVHLFARTPAAFERYMAYVEEIWDGPVIADSSDPVTRAAVAAYVSEMGYADKTVYNSVSVATTSDEEVALASSEVDSAIVLGYNPTDSTVEGTFKALEEGVAGGRGLLALAVDLGVKNVLIDPGVRPMGDGSGSALRFSVAAKARLGLPVGSGIHNAPSSWSWLKSRPRDVRRCCDASTAALQILAAGDYVLYGPIENAEHVFPLAAMADVMVAEAVREMDVYPSADHPIFRLV